MESLYTWQYEDNKNRGSYWYIIALSILVWVVIWGFITGQYWMSFIVLFISWLFYYIENNSEEVVIVSLSEIGVQIWQNFYEYSKIEKFTYIYDWREPVFLRLVVNKLSLKNIDLNIDISILNDLKNILPNYLTEDQKWELSLLEKFIHKLKL